VIVAAVPTKGPSGVTGKDMLEAARLVLAEHGGKIGNYTVALKPAELYAEAHAASDLEGVTRSAAAAVADPQTVGWLGSFDSNETAVALPLLNSGGVSVVSATASATPFTSRDPAFPGAPIKYFPDAEVYGRNFARTTADDDQVASVAMRTLSQHGVRRIFIADAGDTDGVAFGSSVRRLATKHGIRFVGSESVASREDNWASVVAKAIDAGADAIAWGSVPESGERDLFSAMAGSGQRLTLALGPALLPAQVERLPDTGGPVWLFSGNVDSTPNDRSRGQFSDRFRKRTGHSPAPGAENAAFAMGFFLRAIRSAVQSYSPEPGGETMRSVVSRGFHSVRAVTVFGRTISMSKAGERKMAPVGVWSRLERRLVFEGLTR